VKSSEQKSEPDVLVANAGSVFTFCPLSARAKEWISQNVETESWQWLGAILVVDHGYALGLAEGMLSDGLILR
jgi:hypothetical protein